jgi:hypothetical protein
MKAKKTSFTPRLQVKELGKISNFEQLEKLINGEPRLLRGTAQVIAGTLLYDDSIVDVFHVFDGIEQKIVVRLDILEGKALFYVQQIEQDRTSGFIMKETLEAAIFTPEIFLKFRVQEAYNAG